VGVFFWVAAIRECFEKAGLLFAHSEMVERLVVHRRTRKNKVANALRDAGPGDVEAFVSMVYEDTPDSLHRLRLVHCWQVSKSSGSMAAQTGPRSLGTPGMERV